MTPIPPIPDPDPVERYAQLLDCGKSHLAGELVRAEQRIAKLTAQVASLEESLSEHEVSSSYVKNLEAQNTRLKAPVSDEEWAKNDNGRCIVQDAWTHKRTMMTRMEIDALIASRATRTTQADKEEK